MQRIRDLLFLFFLKLCKPVLNDNQFLTRARLLFVALKHYEALAISRNIIGIVKAFRPISGYGAAREQFLWLTQDQRRLRLHVHRHNVVAGSKEQLITSATPARYSSAID